MSESSTETSAVEPIGEGVIGPATVQWSETYVVTASMEPATAPRLAKVHSAHMIFAPDEVSASWYRTGGPGNPWTLNAVNASGPRVLKGEGRYGVSISERWSRYGHRDEMRPEWLFAWAEQQALPV